MKKLFFFLSIATILSCSKSDDDSDSKDSNSKLHPPAWVQGTWVNYSYNNPSQGINGCLKFTNDDIIEIHGDPNNPSVSISFKEQFKYSTITEEFFSDKYITTFSNTVNGTTITQKGYYFKTSNTTFKYDNQSNIIDAYLIYNKI